MVLKAKLKCRSMRLKVGDKGGARDIFPTIPGLHRSLGIWYLTINATIGPRYSMSPKLRPTFAKSATVIDRLGSPNPMGNPNQESTRRAFFRFSQLFSGLQDATRIWNPMVPKAKPEYHSMRPKVGCKGTLARKQNLFSRDKQPNCTCIL